MEFYPTVSIVCINYPYIDRVNNTLCDPAIIFMFIEFYCFCWKMFGYQTLL